MHRRLILLSYLALQLDTVFAGTVTWNCDKSTKNNQWGCVAPHTGTPRHYVPPKSEDAIEKIFRDTLSAPKPIATPKALKLQKPITPFKKQPSEPSIPDYVQTYKTRAPNQIEPALRPQIQKPAPRDIVKAPLPPPVSARTAAPELAPAQIAGHTAPPKLESTTPTQIAEQDDDFQLFTPAFDRTQEQVFKRLRTRLKADPWAACSSDSFEKVQNPYNTMVSHPELRMTAPIQVESDYSEIFDKVITSFSGDVKIDRADQNVLADKVNYNSEANVMDAQGHVYYSDDELSLFSDSVLLNLGTDEARLRDSLFISPRSAVRGKAKVVYQENKDFSHYKDVSYTSCPPGNQDWIIHASRFKMNKLSGKAAATNAWLEFKGVPLLYTPYISFPIDDRRKSGFLAPTWSTIGQSGFNVILPFYWNIAPNYDLIFRPRYTAKRGLMLGGDFRYMNKISNSKLSLEVLPSDPLYNDSTRFQSSFKNQTILTPHMSANFDLNYVSDKQYFRDLGNALSFANTTTFMASVASLNYAREGVDFSTRIENYQSLFPTAQLDALPSNIQQTFIPYRKLPQVTLNLNHSFEHMPLTVGMENQFTLFQHSGTIASNINFVDGERVNIKPYISAPIENQSGFVIPKASFLHTDYFLNHQYSGGESNITRNLPILSLDSGLFAEGNLNLFGSNLTHTLEPRLFYLYIPKSNQNDQPIFDTGIFDINFDSLFRENRFNGIDRVQNANQMTVALTSRFLDNDTGMERLKMSVGDVVYFQDRQEQWLRTVDGQGNPSPLRIISPETNRFSNIVTEVSGQLTKDFSFSSSLLWDPYTNTAARKQINLHYQNGSGTIFNIGYLQRKNYNLSLTNPVPIESLNDDQIRLADVSFRLPLVDSWNAVGRWQYLLLTNQTAESFLGLEKESCCWRFRIIGRHYINGLVANDGAITPLNTTGAIGTTQTSVMFQIELKSLSAFGDEVDAFLKRNIFGYDRL